MQYTREIPEDADIMTVADFETQRQHNYLTDDDGVGFPVRNGKMMDSVVSCRLSFQIPTDATHIAWYGK